MPTSKLQSRRHVVTAGLSGAATMLGGVSGSNAANAEPTLGTDDEWLDYNPKAVHRILFDTTSSAGLGQAVAFADVYYRVNKKSYGVDTDKLSVLVVMHHVSTAFGFDDAIWSKYGKALSDKGDHVTDPRTKRAPALNVYNTKTIDSLKNGGTTLDSLSEKGARFAVCDTATHGIANLLSRITHQSADTIYAELTGHLIRNAVLVPAGITAINRAQEKGYSYTVAI